MKNFIKKITSRKFLLALLTEITAIAQLLSASENEKLKLIAMLTIPVVTIIYATIEGHIDAKAVIHNAEKIVDILEKNKEE
jgi:hypothetical protein